MKRKQKTASRLRFIECLEARRCMSAAPFGASLAQPDAATQAQISQAYGQLPLSFEANQGQTDSQVNFLSRGSGYTLFLSPAEAVLSLGTGEANDVVRMHIVGADPNARSGGLEAESARTNYLIGGDSSQWHTDVANYGKVEYQDVYSGIDLVYYGNQRRLEYDFVVAPGADPNVIQLAFDGVQSIELDANGNLILHTAGGDLVKDAPVIYQEIDGARSSIAGRYLVEHGQVRFDVGAYDHNLPLVIDPILSYSTYLGGKGNDYGYGIAVDDAGNAYITGYTVATNFPMKSPLQPANIGGRSDVFVTKMNSMGTGLVYSTYLGGSSDDWGLGIALDNSNNVYVTGWTSSTNFPAFNALDVTLGGVKDAFVVKLNSSGSSLLFSTFLGGSGSEEGQGIAVNGAGNAYVTGWTSSTSDFPTTTGAFQTVIGGRLDAFVAKFDTTAPSLVYSTYLGGATSDERAYGIAVDSSGSAYVTGVTLSSDFPVAPGLTGAVLQRTLGGGRDAFVTKVNAAGSGLDYSTYLGGLGEDVGNAIAVDKATGEAYVLGSTYSTNFPVANAYQPTYGGSGDAFVSRLSASGTSLDYSSYLGGSRWEGGDYLNTHAGIAVDTSHKAYVTGFTQSTNFPTKNPLPGQGALQYTDDAFVTKIDTSLAGAASLVFSTYLGGSDSEEGFAIGVDAAGNVFVTGETQSIQSKQGQGGFPVTTGAFQSRKSTGDDIHVTDAFVTKISFGAALLSASGALAMHQGTVATPLTLPQVQPLLDEALGRWLAVGADNSDLQSIDLRIANLGGATLGLASGNTIWLDDNAAGWGWFVDSTPGNDLEFVKLGNQGEQHRMDLLTVVMHELGHVLGHDHDADGVMAETLAVGVRRIDVAPDHAALLDQVFGQLNDQHSNAWIGDMLDEPLNSSRPGIKRRR